MAIATRHFCISISIILILPFVAAEYKSESDYSPTDSDDSFENLPEDLPEYDEYDNGEEDSKYENEDDDNGEEDSEYSENVDDDPGEEDSEYPENEDDDPGEEDSKYPENEDDDFGEEDSKYPENEDDDLGKKIANILKMKMMIPGEKIKVMILIKIVAKVPVMIDRKIRCGGAIISKKYILTASHCVYLIKSSNKRKCEGQSREKNCYYSPKNISIKLLGKKKFGKVVKIKKIITHPKFDHMKIINDIALLELAESLKCSKGISPICLPTNKEVYKKGQKVTVAGWGKTKDSEPDGSSREVLKEGVMKEISPKKCLRPGLSKSAVKQYHCVVGTKQTSCQGDSGSSMFVKHKGKFYTLGVVSHGKVKRCHLTWPITNSKTLYFLKWIKKHVKNLPKASRRLQSYESFKCSLSQV
ncbi:trypsin-1 [Trichonephila inaurata madagascariensis]|uniref:Trypsin-1 n=1 Tax=Trichonephila inaurata madagascariensis TaxID=2747483 RepID=A0A8X6JN10_9ARAC|nr:trypsin-1 [Trichonephila inaurata madagascariensis]